MGYTAIVDYNVGNLASIRHAMDYLGAETRVTAEEAVLEKADGIILPGVGAFPDAYAQLEKRALPAVLHRMAEKKPILGICLGMQLLMSSSAEGRLTRGLDFVPGKVARIPTALKLPHIGWNALHFPKGRPVSPLFQHIKEGDFVYFVHSYYAADCDEAVIATAEYGAPLTAAVQNGNVYGTQFHPEKSGEVGLAILRAFAAL